MADGGRRTSDQIVPRASTMAHPTGCGVAVKVNHDERDEHPAVPLWTGRECPALRRTLREKVGEFAARLGASDHLVYTWESRGTGEPPLEQQAADLRIQLDERDQDLTAARAANRQLMTQLNAPRQTRS
jgi:DNA-binding transcriptional regulator YiaG